MGSASREALANVKKLLDSPIAETVAFELLAVAVQLNNTPQLTSALQEQTPAEQKQALVQRVYKELASGTRSILAAAAAERWSSTAEFIAGIEELGLRAVAATHPGIDEELTAIAAAIDASHELQLNLGSKLAEAKAKVALATGVFADKVSPSALVVLQHLVSYPAGRKVSVALRAAAKLAADQAGYALAEVQTAFALDATRQDRLRKALAQIAGRPVKISTVIDPSLVGGLRVKLADEVIDGSVRARLDDLRLQLA